MVWGWLTNRRPSARSFHSASWACCRYEFGAHDICSDSRGFFDLLGINVPQEARAAVSHKSALDVSSRVRLPSRPMTDRAAKSPAEKKPVSAINPRREQDFPEWYQQVVREADLAENSDVRGC